MWATWASAWTPESVRPAPWTRISVSKYFLQRRFQNALDGARRVPVRARRLHLPPFEERPQIRQLELQPHGGDYGRAPRGPRAIVGAMATPAAPALVVTEIFRSLQGESHVRGTPLLVRAPDGLRPALRLVRQRVRVPGREDHAAGRDPRRGRAPGRASRRAHGRRAARAGGVLSALRRALRPGIHRARRNGGAHPARPRRPARHQDRRREVPRLGHGGPQRPREPEASSARGTR